MFLVYEGFSGIVLGNVFFGPTMFCSRGGMDQKQRVFVWFYDISLIEMGGPGRS